MKLIAQFGITTECNLRCKYCYQRNKHTGVMSRETAYKILDSLLPLDYEKYGSYFNTDEHLDVLQLYFFGGEVTLYPKLMEDIVSYAFGIIERNNLDTVIEIVVNTNGTIMSKELRAFYARYKKHINIALTLDGCKECHDMCRIDANGNGSWDKIMNNLDFYFTFFPSSKATKVTINKDNVYFLFESFKTLENLGFLQMQCYPANSLYDWNQECVDEYERQLTLVLDYIKSKDGNCSLEYKPFELGSMSQYNWINHRSSCGVIQNTFERQISFDIYGNVFNCLRYGEHNTKDAKYPLYTLGNVNNEGKIIDELGEERLEALRTAQFNYPENCFKCKVQYAAACENCPSVSYEETGKLDTVLMNDYECQMRKILYKKSLEYLYWKQKLGENNDGNKI